MIYDAAIVGTGPAGLSAALNLKIRDKRFIWIGSRSFSDKVTKAEQIANYPGFLNVSGAALSAAFRTQAAEMGLSIAEHMVNNIMPFDGHYALMAGNEFYEANTVILATGTARTVTLPGEARLLGQGVSYCATCDGNLYRGKTIAVICGAPRFEPEVSYLAGLAEKVYCFPGYQPATVSGEYLEIRRERVTEILGEARVTGVRLHHGAELAVDGVFCLRDSVALSALLPGLATENGHIAVDRSMATNLPGVFAAGDCTGRPYQYAKAVGEGNVAAHSVLEYLEKR